MITLKFLLSLGIILSFSIQSEPIQSTKDEIISAIFDNYANSISYSFRTYLTFNQVSGNYAF